MYDNLDPLIALAAAAACTSRIRLISTVVNVNWRANPRLLAKQISSVVRVSGGRLSQALAPTDPRLAHVPPRPHPLAERRPAQPPRCDIVVVRCTTMWHRRG